MIAGLHPEQYIFDVTSPGYARWWSESDSRYMEDKANPDPNKYWGHDTGRLVFVVEKDMKRVEILVEKSVRIRGRVVDPDGVAVSRATILLSQAGQANDWFIRPRQAQDDDPKSDGKGEFEMFVPASNDLRYNLVALDSPIGERRQWANGVSQPFRTRPGQEINDVKVVLTRPAAVSGKVLDQKGQPSTRTYVSLLAVDDLENRTCPQMWPNKEGTFDFPIVRPGRYLICAEPFIGPASSKELTLKEDETISNIVLTIADDPLEE